MTFPTIHRNGSHGPTLLEEYAAADAAALALLQALQAIDFNARDYYVQGPSAFEAARTEHQRRYTAITDIRKELHEIMDSIVKQGEKQ